MQLFVHSRDVDLCSINVHPATKTKSFLAGYMCHSLSLGTFILHFIFSEVYYEKMLGFIRLSVYIEAVLRFLSFITLVWYTDILIYVCSATTVSLERIAT